MSKAFTREDEEGVEDLPDRPISPHRNLVTAEGLAEIEENLRNLREEEIAAEREGDTAKLARIARDQRYWQARLQTAEVVPPPADTDEVRFGSTVTVRAPDGTERTWRIVGEDEADPGRGTISYVSPVAQALLGGKVGEVVEAGPGEWEILKIS